MLVQAAAGSLQARNAWSPASRPGLPQNLRFWVVSDTQSFDDNREPDAVVQDSIEIRVQYNETDGQGRVHHAQYLNYFERGRVELMRSLGYSYRDFEADGLMLVVAEMNVRYRGAAVFDDQLQLRTRVSHTGRVRIEHSYHLVRVAEPPSSSSDLSDPSESSSDLIVEGTSVIACVGRDGKLRKLPDYLRMK